MSGEKFGLELVRHSVGGAGNKAEAVVVLVHWRLLSEGLRCCGNGDAFSSQTDTRPSELLPAEWNSNADVYQLKYRHRKTNEKFVLKAVPGGPLVTLVLMRVGDEKVQQMEVDTNAECDDVTIKNEDKLLQAVEDKLIRPFFPQEKKEEEKKPASRDPGPPPRDPDYDPLREPRYPDMPGPPRPGMPDMPFGPRPGADPFFDPMGLPGGGEMYMDRPGRRPPGGGRFPGGGGGGMGGGFPGGGFGGGGFPGGGFM